MLEGSGTPRACRESGAFAIRRAEFFWQFRIPLLAELAVASDGGVAADGVVKSEWRHERGC